MVSLRLRGLDETKKYSLQPTLKKIVKLFNANVNGMLKSGIYLDFGKTFRIFAISKIATLAFDGFRWNEKV